MARLLPIGLTDAINRPHNQVETHSTLELTIMDGGIPMRHFWATAKLAISGVSFQPHLRNGGAVKTSLTRAADRVDVALQNADLAVGVDLLKLQDLLAGSEVKFGRYWRDESAAEFHKVLLTGVVAGVSIDEDFVRLTLLSDAYAAVSVGASRRVARLCQWRFRDPSTCGYNGAELVCNFLIDDAGGCHGRHGDPLKRAKIGAFVYIESKSSVAGAAGLPLPASNQLLKSNLATLKQQPIIELQGFALANDDAGSKTTVRAKVVVMVSQINVVGNVGGGLDDLHAATVPAGTLANDGDWVEIFASGRVATNTNNKRIVYRCDQTTQLILLDTGFVNYGTVSWEFYSRITRIGAASVRATVRLEFGNGQAVFDLKDHTFSGNLDSIDFFPKSLAESQASATDDITEKIFQITKYLV